MLSEDARSRLLREVVRAGSCSHPVRLVGHSVNLVTGEWAERQFKIACKDRRAKVCLACSERYETDAWIIAASGVNGGKGVPATVAYSPRLFVTVTAPSFGAVHTRGSAGGCVATRPGRASQCAHGMPTSCEVVHEVTDTQLGHPLCSACFDATGAILWNAQSTRLWSETIRRARQNLMHELGTSRRKGSRSIRLEYVKVVEMQRRGLVHFHALVRLDASTEVANCDGGTLARALRQAIRSTRTHDEAGEYRFGAVADVQVLGEDASDVKGAASYLAKYVTKTASGTLELARRFSSRAGIERAVADEHLRALALTAWDLKMTRHANTLGYRGQFLTKSRSYSTTFAELRAARRAYWNPSTDPDPEESHYLFDGRGYDDPRGAELAEVLARLDRERRRDERRSAKERDDDR